jgi:hypothetical protein
MAAVDPDGSPEVTRGALAKSFADGSHHDPINLVVRTSRFAWIASFYSLMILIIVPELTVLNRRDPP